MNNKLKFLVPLLLMLFNGLQLHFSYTQAAFITGMGVMVISILAAYFSEETYGKDLHYYEV